MYSIYIINCFAFPRPPSTVSPTTTEFYFLKVWAKSGDRFTHYCEPPLSILVGADCYDTCVRFVRIGRHEVK